MSVLFQTKPLGAGLPALFFADDGQKVRLTPPGEIARPVRTVTPLPLVMSGTGAGHDGVGRGLRAAKSGAD